MPLSPAKVRSNSRGIKAPFRQKEIKLNELRKERLVIKKIISLILVILVLMFSVSFAVTDNAEATNTVSGNDRIRSIAQERELEKARAMTDAAQNGKLPPIRPSKDGDVSRLAVTRSESGTYPTRKGSFLVNLDPGIDSSGSFLGVGHAAMVYSGSYTVESYGYPAPYYGVQLKANDWKTRYKSTKFYGKEVSGTSIAQDALAGDYAYAQIGKPYLWDFWDMSTRNAFYCSQLVWAAFKDKTGVDLNDDGANGPC